METDQRKVRCVVSYKTKSDFTGTLLDLGVGAAGYVAETGQPLIINDYSKWAGRAVVYEEKQPFQVVMSAPMLWQGKVSGVIHVLRDDVSKKFTQKELNLLLLFANHAAVAVETARLFNLLEQELIERKQMERALRQAKETLDLTHRQLEESFSQTQELARLDGLTGVNNRRYLFELAERELDVALRYQLPLSMMVFDIDDFKRVNDMFGHLVGDQALKRITQAAQSIIRSADVFGRYGGDEFVVLLPQSGSQKAFSLAERFQANIATMYVETDESPFIVTISIGIAQVLHHTSQPDSVKDLFLRADEALYVAKKAGKNRIVISEQE